MRLFAVYIGGMADGAHIELHDMRFIAAKRIEDTYEELRRQWWGIPSSLHMDAWAELTQADGYRVELKREKPADTTYKLYYVNVGGYNQAQFIELHQNLFVVAESESKAKVRALRAVMHWESFHKDDLFEAEQCFDLSSTAAAQEWFIHMTPDTKALLPPFTCGYKKLAA